jgi:AcrR family transcriptional regulator
MSVSHRATQKNKAKAPERSPRHHPDDAKRLITQSALQFLWEYPFRELTVAKLMAGTSLSRPAFYQYFDDLHGLAESLLHEIEAAMRQTANPWINGEGEPIAALRVALDGVVRSCVEHGPIIRAVAEAAPLDERLERAWSDFMKRWDDSVEARIKVQQREGLIAKTLDARRTANALNALDAAVLISEFGRRPQGDPDAVLEAIHNIWVGALYGRSPKRLPISNHSVATSTNKKRKTKRRSSK